MSLSSKEACDDKGKAGGQGKKQKNNNRKMFSTGDEPPHTPHSFRPQPDPKQGGKRKSASPQCILQNLANVSNDLFQYHDMITHTKGRKNKHGGKGRGIAKTNVNEGRDSDSRSDDFTDNSEDDESEVDESEDEEARKAAPRKRNAIMTSSDDDEDVSLEDNRKHAAEMLQKRKRKRVAAKRRLKEKNDDPRRVGYQGRHLHDSTNTMRDAAKQGGRNVTDDNMEAETASMMEHMPIRGYSRRESIEMRDKHVAERITTYVKKDMFRRIKFIVNDSMLKKAFEWVQKLENVRPHRVLEFRRMYKSCFMEALNTKRSTCEQAGGRIVENTLKYLPAKEFFTMEELCKLRQPKTHREGEAAFWFYGTFLECVTGKTKSSWGGEKYTSLVSEAKEGGTGKPLVTPSDEAFALLLFENYSEKWMTPRPQTTEFTDDPTLPNNIETPQDLEQRVHDSEPSMTGTQTTTSDLRRNLHKTAKEKRTLLKGKSRTKTASKRSGKYTSKKSGHCEYGGWSKEGVLRFNELYHMVIQDRGSRNAKLFEETLREQLCVQLGDTALLTETNENIEGTQVSTATIENINACWDLE